MASKYQQIVELAASEAKHIVSSTGNYMAFLTTSANNHKYSFREQLLIHAQKPDATACAEISFWNLWQRWVNRGTKGIALLVEGSNRYKLRYVFDISDTNSRENPDMLQWKMQDRFEGAVSQTLESHFGISAAGQNMPQLLMETARKRVEHTLPDHLRDLLLVKNGSFLEELDNLNLEVWFRTTLENSVGFMLLQRCGYEVNRYFVPEDFAHVAEFNTHETISILGAAVSTTAKDILYEIEKTVRRLQREERKLPRTVASQEESVYDIGRINSHERRTEHGTDLHQTGRLPDSRFASPQGSEAGQVWDAAAFVPHREAERTVHRDDAVGKAGPAPEGHRQSGEQHDGPADEADGAGGGRDRSAESQQPDGVGTPDEQYPQPGGGNREESADLQLSGRNGNFQWDVEFYHQDDEKNELIRTNDALKEHRTEIAAFFADHPDSRERGSFIKGFFDNTFVEQILSNGQRAGYRAYDDMFHIWRGSYLTREREVYYRWSSVADHIYGMILIDQWLAPNEVVLPSEDAQIAMISQAEQDKSSAFVLPQAAIDYVLCRGSNVVDCKFRIYEHFQKKLTPAENIDFLKNEYGWGGSSNGIPGSGYWKQFDSNGISISRSGYGSDKDNTYLIKWPAAEKRIRELIEADRYLSPADKKEYVAYSRKRALRDQRRVIAEEFKSIVYDYNDFQEQLGNTDARLNLYVLGDCTAQFIVGSKTTWTQGNDNFILPLMRAAMNTIISENTHLTERCKAMLDHLNSDLAKPMEPTYDELNPPAEAPREYRFNLGDTVRIGMKDYEILAMDGDNIRLFDPEFPLFNQEMSRQEFMEQLETDPWNDKYLHKVELPVLDLEGAIPIPDTTTEKPAEEPIPFGRIEYLHSDGRVREQIEYTDLEQFEADLRKDNDCGVPMQVTLYADRTGKTVPHRFIFELDPPLLGKSVILNPYLDQMEKTPSQSAMELIQAFCQEEYQSDADFSDLRNIGIAHTTITDAEIPVQINVNLEEFSLDRYVEGVIVDRRRYNSLDELITQELENLDFDELSRFTDDQLARVSIHSRENKVVTAFFSDDERIAIVHAVNGFFFNYYGYDPVTGNAKSIAGPFDTHDEAEAAMLSHRPQAKQAEVTVEDRDFIDCFYVVEDLSVQGQLQITEHDTLFLAMQAYSALPSDKMKALGVRNTNELPGSLDLLQCKDGVDTIIEDYLKVEGWQNEEILGTVRQIKKQLDRAKQAAIAAPAPKPRERAASTVLYPSIPNEQRSNFRIQDDDLGVGTPGQRYAANVKAIRLLKQLEAEERLASPEEQEVLSHYVGWGGLADCFEERHSKYAELKALLTDEEYAAARESTLTAFYTPPVVIRAMYQALENMNFRNGNILEPSCGVGNFMGMIPDSMSRSKIYGVELDSISGRIAQQLYQKSSIAVQGFEKTELPDSFFDAAIGNVPFGQFKVSDKRYDKHNFLIHDYFFGATRS